MIQEKNSERIAAQKEHQKTIDNLRKEHKKELEVQLGHSASYFSCMHSFKYIEAVQFCVLVATSVRH